MTLETDFPLNIAFFHAINAGEAPNQTTAFLAEILAEYSPWVVLAVFGLAWLFGNVLIRRATVIAGSALAMGLAVNFLIAFLVYVPRPFEMGIGHTLLAHSLETSLPSDHATFIWALGFGLLCSGELAWMSVGVIILGGLTAWARIFLGVHFPLDMAASLVISIVAAGLARAAAPWLSQAVFRPLEWGRERILHVVKFRVK